LQDQGNDVKQQLLEDALERLEWPRITAALADCACLPIVQKKLRSLVAIETPAHRTHLLTCQREIKSLEASQGVMRVRPFEAESVMNQVRRGSTLSLEGLWHCSLILENAHDVVTYTKAAKQSNRHHDHPTLIELLAQVKSEPDLGARLKSSVDEKPSLLSTASPALKSLRSRVANAKRKVEEQLSELMKKSHIRDALQDSIWMQRDGRYVLPVRTDRKSEVSGTARGISSSGSTVFIEPAELSAAQSQLEAEETEMLLEEARIMRELSDACHLKFESLASTVSLLEIYDGIRARAIFGTKIGGVEPTFHADRKHQPAFHFEKAVHPFFVLESKNAVANSLTLQKNILVISGPNAGGKTVAMKTAALLTVMALSGLCVSASEAHVYEFENLCIEMGDRQNILDDLSTFSGHLVQIKKILDEGNEKTLIVLDEGFVGTDPTLGVALARATLETLADMGATVIITTHFSGLKGLAEADSRFQNASLEFEPQGLRPTYRLLSDIPGQSFAIELASRLGLPQSLLSKARTYAGEESLRVEKLLSDLATKRDELDLVIQFHKQELETVRTERIELEEYSAQIAELKSDLSSRMVDKFQKRFNVFDNQLTIRERQFERAKKQELQSPSTLEKIPTADSVSQGAAIQNIQPKKNPISKTASTDSKPKSISSFEELSNIQFATSQPESQTEAKFTNNLPAKLREKNVAAMSTRELLDEAADSLSEMRTGWQKDAFDLSRELDSLDELVKSKTGLKKAKKSGHANQPPAPGIVPRPVPNARRSLQKGDKVKSSQFKETGVVLASSDSKGRIECQFGLIKIKLPEELLTQSGNEDQNRSQDSKKPTQNWNAYKKQTENAPYLAQRMDMTLDTMLPHKGNTLDVRGALVDTAIEKVEDFLDRCWREDLSPFVIIHGHGTGRVKQAIREFLHSCTYKIKWRPGTSGEGADGATVVVLLD
jgi:DNA mismatch repair protein MutS2